jgi:hypothetical protein
MRRLLALFVLINNLAQSDVVTIYNSGAEIGTTSGWTNTHNHFNAINNSALAWEGNWFFETSHIFNAENTDGYLQRIIDLKSYYGLITDLNISISLAQDPGQAFDPVANKSYIYEAVAAAVFLDYNGVRSEYGFGFALNSSSSWENRGQRFGPSQVGVFPEFPEKIGAIQIYLAGVWFDSESGIGGLDVPSSIITDVPNWTRFDDLKIEISLIPEPSALSLFAIGLGGLAMMRRRRS